MSVAHHLGLDMLAHPGDVLPDDPEHDAGTHDARSHGAGPGQEPPATRRGIQQDGDLLARACRWWPVWRGADPALGAPVVWDLPRWLRAAGPAAADAALQVLAELACPDGGDDLAATAVLAWVMVPGASRLAFRLHGLTPRIDEVVAAHLWVQARTIGNRRRPRVAANILWTTRREVLADLGVGAGDRTWAMTRPVADSYLDRVGSTPHHTTGRWMDPWTGLWTDDRTDIVDASWPGALLGCLPAADEAAVRLHRLLAQACRHGVITAAERDLLLALARSTHAAAARVGCGRGGLTAHRAAVAVGAELGLSPRTVRRRAAAALSALTAVAGHLSADPVPASAARAA